MGPASKTHKQHKSPPAPASKAPTPKKEEKKDLKRKKAMENNTVYLEDTMEGVETGVAPGQVVIIDNAEYPEPQQQEDNSDEYSGNRGAKPMVQIQNGHHDSGPPKPILNFWDDVPAEEYATHKVVVEPMRSNVPIEYPF